MRPGQNKRMRGRNNRKGPNPLTRTYESNGPDVKIRGTAQHVAEKYLQLARDAQSSGDIVVAENYLQHAEHYYRLIFAAQAAQAQAQMGYGGRPGEEIEEDEDDDFIALPDRFASPLERSQPVLPPPNGLPQGGHGGQPMGMSQPQPYLERPAFNGEMGERPQNGGERQERQDRPDRQDRQDRPDRQNRNDRRFGGQNDRGERNNNNNQPHRNNRFREQPPRFEPAPENREQPDVEFPALNSALPAFITAPTRPVAPQPVAPQPVAPAPLPPVSYGEAPGAEPAPVASVAGEEGEGQFHLRPRRRRRARPDGDEGGPAPASETSSAE